MKPLKICLLVMLIRSSELFILGESCSCIGHADVSLADVAQICAGKDVHLIHIQEQVGAGWKSQQHSLELFRSLKISQIFTKERSILALFVTLNQHLCVVLCALV